MFWANLVCGGDNDEVAKDSLEALVLCRAGISAQCDRFEYCLSVGLVLRRHPKLNGFIGD